jgi:hypothetical protein
MPRMTSVLFDQGVAVCRFDRMPRIERVSAQFTSATALEVLESTGLLRQPAVPRQ